MAGAINRLMKLGTKHFGIHAFLASNTVSNEYYPELAGQLFRLAVRLRNATGVHISFINLSGGVGVDYRPEQPSNNIALIGDGACTGGMAYEALNHIGGSHSKMLIVLNDNKMSISENIGGMAAYLGKVRTNTKYVEFKDDLEQTLRKTKLGTKLVYGLKRSKDSIKHFFVPSMFFEDMGITYLGPVDGHDTRKLEFLLRQAKEMKEPVQIELKCLKNRNGYQFTICFEMQAAFNYFAEVEPAQLGGFTSGKAKRPI